MQQNNDTLAFPEVLIFGAGLSGMSAYKNLVHNHHILGFIDNNPARQGQLFCDLPVYSPAIIHTLEFQLVYIASEYIESIETQLLQQLNVPWGKVKVLPSYMTKPMQFGEQTDTAKSGQQILSWLCQTFNQANIHYFLDAGTLLGIVRDGALIPWDDDLDIGIPVAELAVTRELLEERLMELEQLTGLKWQLAQITSEKKFGAIQAGDVRSLKLSCRQDKVVFPMVDVFVKYPNGESADYALASRGISMPIEHFLATENMEFAGVTMKLPAMPELYLERYYGDWRTPKKDWDVGMIKSASSF